MRPIAHQHIAPRSQGRATDFNAFPRVRGIGQRAASNREARAMLQDGIAHRRSVSFYDAFLPPSDRSN